MQIDLVISILSSAIILTAMVASAFHVVMYKRDVRAAIGWIALIGFAPILGIVLYWIFGINRIQRKAKILFSGLQPVELPFEQRALYPNNLQSEIGGQEKQLFHLARLTEKVTVKTLLPVA